MTTLENELSKVREFFEHQNKGEGCFYRLYTIKFADSNYTKADLRGSNFKTDSVDSSIERLSNEIKAYGPQGKKFFLLRHYTYPTDSNPVNYVFENPFFREENQKNSISSINGFGQNNDIIGLVKEHHEAVTSLREEIQAMKHENEMSALESRIYELEEGAKGKIGAITDFFQTEMGQKLGMGIFGLLTASINQGGNSSPKVDTKKEEYQEPISTQNTDNQANFETDNPQVRVLNDSIIRFDKVFEGDGLNALYELSLFCENNPEMAKQLRNQQRGKNGNNE